MFSWKRKSNVDELMDAIKGLNQVVPPAAPKSEEHYRVGFDEATRMVTLTLIANGGSHSMTLSMDVKAVDKLKRMLDAAKPLEDEDDVEPEA
jgi:hypothetical protein